MTQNRITELRGAGLVRRLLALVMVAALLAMCGVAALAEGACTLTVLFDPAPKGTVVMGLYKVPTEQEKNFINKTETQLREAAQQVIDAGGTPTPASVDAAGKAVFSNIEAGYYVGTIIQDSSDEYLEMSPIVVNLLTTLTVSAKVEVTSQAEITKKWSGDSSDDEGDYVNKPDHISVTLLSDAAQQGVFDKYDTYELTSDNNWYCKVTGLPRATSDGRLIEYKWVEPDPSEYTPAASNSKESKTAKFAGADGKDTEVTYMVFTGEITNTLERTNVTVTKVWDDNDNQDGFRPESVAVYLKADGVELRKAESAPQFTNVDPSEYEVELSEANGWTYTWTDLLKYNAANKPIEYTVGEDDIDKDRDYSTSYSDVTYDESKNTYTVTVTNKHTPDKVSLNVFKVWEDGLVQGEDNRDGLRPETLTVHLYADGTLVDGKDATLSAENGWKYEWEDLDKRKDGTIIEYTVQEDELADYTLTTDGEGTYTITLTNKHTPEVVTFHIEKEWDDDDDRDRVRPGEITVQLLGSPKGSAEEVINRKYTITPDEDGNWALDVPQEGEDVLPKYYPEGIEINYTLQEVTDLADYDDNPTISLNGDTFTVTNSRDIDRVNVVVDKVWNPEGGSAADITVQLLADGAVTDQQTLSRSNNYTYTWTDLPKNNDGTPIVYTVQELNPPINYVATYSEDTDGTDSFHYIITNTYQLGSLSITKNVTVNGAAATATAADGTYTFLVTYPDGSTATVSISIINGQSNSTTLTGLQPGTYTVSEINLPTGVTLASANNVSANVVANETASVSFTNEITVTPTPTPTPEPTVTPTPEITPTPVPTTSVEGVKIWDDENNIHGIRPDSIVVTLYANGVPAAYTPTWSGTDSSNWSYVFSGLPAVDSTGAAITYTVAEVTVPGYETTVSGTTILNELIPQTPEEYTDIDGEKQWNDNGNADGVRPNYITVTLYQDGVPIATRTVTAANNWQFTFQSMPVDDGYGHIYEYTVVESTVPGYISIVNGTTIVNTRIPGDNPPPDNPPDNPPENPEEPPRNPPPFEEFSEEELEELLDLFDYGTPLFGRPLGTGDELPVYPFVFAGIGLIAVLVLVLTGRRKGRKA